MYHQLSHMYKSQCDGKYGLSTSDVDTNLCTDSTGSSEPGVISIDTEMALLGSDSETKQISQLTYTPVAVDVGFGVGSAKDPELRGC